MSITETKKDRWIDIACLRRSFKPIIDQYEIDSQSLSLSSKMKSIVERRTSR